MQTFLDLLNKKVQRFKTKYKFSDGKAFGMWLVTEYLGLDEGEGFEAVSIDGGNDKDIDLSHSFVTISQRQSVDE